MFEVTDSDGSQVTHPRKLASIKQVSASAGLRCTEALAYQTLSGSKLVLLLQMLNIHLRGQEVPACNADETDDMHRVMTTVFELAGQDQSGLLADVTHLLTTNGCDVRSAAVSLYILQAINC